MLLEKTAGNYPLSLEMKYGYFGEMGRPAAIGESVWE